MLHSLFGGDGGDFLFGFARGLDALDVVLPVSCASTELSRLAAADLAGVVDDGVIDNHVFTSLLHSEQKSE